jgi:hypothetical protein
VCAKYASVDTRTADNGIHVSEVSADRSSQGRSATKNTLAAKDIVFNSPPSDRGIHMIGRVPFGNVPHIVVNVVKHPLTFTGSVGNTVS